MNDDRFSAEESAAVSGEASTLGEAVSVSPGNAPPVIHPAESPSELVEFLPEEPRRTLPGPGLPEALLWCFGLFAAHAVAAVVMVVVIIVWMLSSGQRWISPAVFEARERGAQHPLAHGPEEWAAFDNLPDEYLLLLIGGDQLLVLLLTLIAVAIRFPGRMVRTLNFSSLRPLHKLIIAGLTLPLSTLCGELYRVTHAGWSQLVEWWPVLRWLDGTNSVDQLQVVAKDAPLLLMLLIIAVAPAVGEELVFRGVIGRGLVARWGVLRGVLLTSVLFGLVHFHPAHALAVIPLGIAMHGLYLATRSMWAPMLLHFLNNAWATVAAKLASGNETAAMEEPTSGVLLLTSATAVLVLGALLYRTRVRYCQPDGKEWDPGYVTVELPPPGVAERVYGSDGSGRNVLTAAVAWATFGVTFILEVAASAQ